MKLSTSTLGCFKWDLPETILRIRDYGFDGIDFRGVAGEMQIWKLPEFSSEIDSTAARISDAGLAVSCLSSGVRLTECAGALAPAFENELLRSAEICAALDCRQIRVFGGAVTRAGLSGEAERPRAVGIVAERVSALAERVAAVAPVELLIETHDDWTCSEHMAAVLALVNRPDVACCWDVKHTYWVAREVPESTWRIIQPWVRNTHWKDASRSVPEALAGDQDVVARVNTAGMLLPVGAGVCPLRDACGLLQTGGYDGWYTLEWEKQWHPHIAEPEVAFPEFVKIMRAWSK